MYIFSDYPRDPGLIRELSKTADRFQKIAAGLSVSDLEISSYNKRYLADHVSRLSSLLKRITYVLAWVIRDTSRPLRDLVFVEYGAGTGLYCCFAKLLGIGTVIYSDHYEPSCRDARAIHQSFGAEADAYLCGEIREVIDFLNSGSLACDAFVSNDCIEHIYDIEDFLRCHGQIPGTRLAVAHASGANTKNPVLAKRWMKYQLQRELEGFTLAEGCKSTELPEPYLAVRRRIISEHAPHLSPEILDILAKNTRGLRKDDIQVAVDTFARTGNLPAPPAHPTNTCDPLTGNWAEHLLDFEHITQLLTEAGFEARILPGPYGGTTTARRLIVPFLNAAIRLAGPAGIYLGHFFTLYGKRRTH